MSDTAQPPPAENPNMSQAVALLEAERLDAPESVAELTEAMFRLIQFRFATTSAAVKLVELNRRYGVTARRLKTTTRACVLDLVKQSRVDVCKYCGCMMVYDYVAVNRHMDPYRQIRRPPGGGAPILPDEAKFNRVFEGILSRGAGKG